MKSFFRHIWLVALVALPLLAACGTSPQTPGTSNLTPVSLALDYTPNTNHTGIYVAQQKGWYKDQGLNLSILPYSQNAAPEALVASGKADFAISYEESVTTANVSGQDLVSIAAIIQHNTSGLVVLADSGITRPAQLAGKVYGNFADPFEPYVISAVINCDGGHVTPDQIKNTSPTLTDDGLGSLQTKKVDYVWIYQGWEGIEAQREGLKLTYFPVSGACVPDYYTPVIITSGKMIKEHPDLVKKFMAATSQGYSYAIQNPDDAANILVGAVPPGTFDDVGLVKQSQEYLSKQYALDAPKWGMQTQAKWHDFPHFLFSTGVLADANGNIVTQEPDESQFFTNDFLP
ncbi:MAG TPA: ABC transporter substrate-binding protein [Ktedonobacterales bacterium]|jgi:ABC-type nitrate/sulfonate/bicarbonate transport system substrate-binding protein